MTWPRQMFHFDREKWWKGVLLVYCSFLSNWHLEIQVPGSLEKGYQSAAREVLQSKVMAETWYRQLWSMYFALSNMWSPELREGGIFKKTTFSNIVCISKWTILAWSCFSDSIKAFFMNQSNGPSGQSHWFLRSTQFYRAESITVSFFLFFTKKV